MTQYVTIKGVEIASAGMAWHGNSDHYLTAEHMADMVAAQDDPLIRSPRVKLGHQDAWFGALAGMHDPDPGSIDGMPGFGSIVNLRLTEDGAKIVGDCVEVPDWLAESVASAYPTRSAEWIWDHETQGGRKYKAVLTDVAFGSWRPAVEDLADITREQATAALIALLQDGPDAAMAAIASGEESPMSKAKTSGADLPSASVSQDRIVSAFEKWAWGDVDDGDNILGDPPPDSGDWYWAWCRDIRVDPDELIACVEGETWAVPFSTDGEVTVTFGTPAQVRETYIPLVASASATTAEARTSQTILARNLPQPERPPKPGSVASTTAATVRPNTEGGEPMDPSVLKFLVGQGHDPETATTEQVSAAEAYCAAFPATPAATADEPDDKVKVPEAAADTPETEAETPSPETERVPVAAARQIPDGMSLIDSETLAALKAGAAAGSQLAAEKATERRDRVLMAARDEGRIPPSRLDHYTRLYDADPEGTTVLLTAAEDKGGLAKGTVPLAARAEAPDPLAAGADGLTAADRSLLATSRSRMGFKAGQEA